MPPSLHFERPNPKIDFATSPFVVNTQPAALAARRRRAASAGVSSLGVGGTNAHVILEEAPAQAASGRVAAGQLLVLSARTRDRARRSRGRGWRAHLRARPELTLGRRRLHAARGPAAVRAPPRRGGRDAAEDAAAAPRGARPATRRHAATAAPRERPGGLPVPGPGRAVPGDGARALRERARLPRGRRRLLRAPARAAGPRPARTCSSRRRRDGGGGRAPARRRALTQPALFVVEYALARLWMSWGVRARGDDRPQHRRVRGRLPRGRVHARGRARPGRRARAADAVDARRARCWRCRCRPAERRAAARAGPRGRRPVNAPALCVVSGPPRPSPRSRTPARARGRDGAPAAHLARLPLGDDGADPGRLPAAGRARCAIGRPRIPYVSNLTGTWITAGRGHRAPTTGSDHLRQHRPLRGRAADLCSRRPTASCSRSGPATRSARWPGSRPRPGAGPPRSSRPAPPARGRATCVPARRPGPAVGARASGSTGARSSPARSAAASRCRPIPSSGSATGSMRRKGRPARRPRGRQRTPRSPRIGSTSPPGSRPARAPQAAGTTARRRRGRGSCSWTRRGGRERDREAPAREERGRLHRGRPGATFAGNSRDGFRIDPASPPDYDASAAALGDQGRTVSRSCTRGRRGPRPSRPRARRRGRGPPAGLLQPAASSSRRWKRPSGRSACGSPRSAGRLQQVLGSDDESSPSKATLLGLLEGRPAGDAHPLAAPRVDLDRLAGGRRRRGRRSWPRCGAPTRRALVAPAARPALRPGLRAACTSRSPPPRPRAYATGGSISSPAAWAG